MLCWTTHAIEYNKQYYHLLFDLVAHDPQGHLPHPVKVKGIKIYQRKERFSHPHIHLCLYDPMIGTNITHITLLTSLPAAPSLPGSP